MGAMASQITSLTIVYSSVYSGADQRKHQSSASLAFVRGIHRWPVNSPHKWPVTRKMFPFDEVILTKYMETKPCAYNMRYDIVADDCIFKHAYIIVYKNTWWFVSQVQVTGTLMNNNKHVQMVLIWLENVISLWYLSCFFVLHFQSDSDSQNKCVTWPADISWAVLIKLGLKGSQQNWLWFSRQEGEQFWQLKMRLVPIKI